MAMKIRTITYMLRQGIKSLWRNRIMSMASIGSVASALIILGIVFMIVLNINGFAEIAVAFEKIAEVERAHEKRFRKIYTNVEQGLVFVRKDVYVWKCRNCGYLHESKSAPQMCPACKHPQAFFEMFCESY